MTVTLANGSYRIDCFVPANESPTGRLLRVRKRLSAKQHDEASAKRLNAEITHSLRTAGRWRDKSSDPTIPQTQAASAARSGIKTLQDAFKLACSDPEEGFATRRAWQALSSRARRAVDFLGPLTPCARVSRDDYTNLRFHVLGEGKSEQTALNVVRALHRILYFAERSGWISRRPKWKPPTIRNQRKFVFSEEQEATAVAFFEERSEEDIRDAFVLGIECGFRLNEMATLTTSRIDLASATVLIPGDIAKNGEDRYVVLTPKAIALLRSRMVRLAPGALVFSSRLSAARISTFMPALRELLGEPGRKDLVFHSTRHTCGTRMAARKVPLDVRMPQLGHKDPKTAMRYTHMTATERKEVIYAQFGFGKAPGTS